MRWPRGARARRALAILFLGLSACLLASCSGEAPPPAKSAKKGAAMPKLPPIDVPLAEITLQFVLDKAWDGRFEDCQRYGQVAMTIAADDLETMEVFLRCAHARKFLWQAEQWVHQAYSVRLASPVARYAFGIAALLHGDPPKAQKIFEKLGPEAPVAYYQAAIAAQIDDDTVAAERLINLYVKAVPNDPAGRALQAEIVCSVDLVRCASIMETIRSTDDDDTVVARRLGAGVAAPAEINRQTLERLSKDAATLGAPAFDDAYATLALVREGGDPAVFVRSPRSGRGEPGGSTDLVRDARPMKRLPFMTRVVQAIARNDPQATGFYGQMLSLFPTELATYHLARRSLATTSVVRKEMENALSLRWRVVAASELARLDETCSLVPGLPWTDRGPVATSVRARCEIASDAARGRKIADDRLNTLPFGALDVATAIEGESAQKDHVALEALAHRIAKIAPTSILVAEALWAAGEAAPKKQAGKLLADAVAQSSYDPSFSRRLLRRYVEAHDVDRAKMTIAQALVEAPLDAYLCGVEGEILLDQGNATGALPWLTKSCTSARARKEQEILNDTLATLPTALGKSKDKAAKEAASHCMKGD